MTPSSKPSLYSRFIPSEEIRAVSVWHFSSVHGDDPSLNPAKAPVLPPMEPPPPPPEVVEAEQVALRDQARAEGFAEGHAAGAEETRQALQAQMAEQAHEATAQLDALLSDMRKQLQAAQARMAETVLEMACELARQVVRQELSTDTSHLTPVVEEAMATLISDTLPVTVKVHPSDFERLEPGWTNAPDPKGPRFVADSSITPGGCRVESAASVVDATLETRWRRAIGNLGLNLPWTPRPVGEQDHG